MESISDQRPRLPSPRSRLDPKLNEIRVLLLAPSPLGCTQPLHCKCEIVSLDKIKVKHAQIPSLTRQEEYARVQDLWGRDSALANFGISQPKDYREITQQNRFEWGDFIALSYCWGDLGDQETIFIDGVAVKIQATLALALRVLRDKAHIQNGVKIWADAICINQKDALERNEHVLRMGAVYQSAMQVVCWLGEESSDSSKAIQLASNVAEEWARSKSDRMTFSLHNTPELLKPQDWLALGSLMNRPYWSRLWIKQELAMGKPDTVLICGQDVIAWGQLYDTIWSAAYCNLAYVEELVRQESIPQTSINSSLSDDPLRRKQLYQLSVLQYKLREFLTPEDRDPTLMHRISAVLDLSRSSAASDCRDKVYGITSLLPTTITSRIRIDYAMEIEQVYIAFAKAVIEGSQKLDILDHTNWAMGQEMPSWVPDWRTTMYTRMFPGIKRKRPYDACAGTTASVQFVGDGIWMQASGCAIDIVDGLGGASTNVNTAESSTRMFQAQRFRGSGTMDATTLRDPLWRTITTNINTNGEPAPDTFEMVLDLLGSDCSLPDASSDAFALKRLTYFQQLMNRSGDLLVAGIPVRACLQTKTDQAGLLPVGRRLVMEQALDRVFRCTRSRRLAVTVQGSLCMVPNATLPSDIIAVVFGCSLPVVLRGREEDGHYTLIGTCYCHGIMNGEAVDWLKSGSVSGTDFVIV